MSRKIPYQPDFLPPPAEAASDDLLLLGILKGFPGYVAEWERRNAQKGSSSEQ
jgi:hypothetical protein